MFEQDCNPASSDYTLLLLRHKGRSSDPTQVTTHATQTQSPGSTKHLKIPGKKQSNENAHRMLGWERESSVMPGSRALSDVQENRGPWSRGRKKRRKASKMKLVAVGDVQTLADRWYHQRALSLFPSNHYPRENRTYQTSCYKSSVVVNGVVNGSLSSFRDFIWRVQSAIGGRRRDWSLLSR